MSQESEESTEHFFTSFTDLLVGVIFLFMLLLMVFALNLKKTDDTKSTIVNDKLIVTEQVRASILQEVARRMEARHVPVALDLDNGVVRLPESLLFESGHWELLPQGQYVVETLAHILAEILPCASLSANPCEWQRQPVQLDTVLIEGHTDNRPFGNAQHFTNWELSAFRSIAVYKAMTAAAPALETAMMNPNYQPLVGVSAYADRRPVSQTELTPNRRIDVRFTMRANLQNIQP